MMKQKMEAFKNFITNNKKKVIAIVVFFVVLTGVIVSAFVFQPKKEVKNVSTNEVVEKVTENRVEATKEVESVKQEDVSVEKKDEKVTTETVNPNTNTEKVTETKTETKPAVKPTTPTTTTPKVEEKKKTCRIVKTPAKYKVIEHPEKFRMEPIYEQRNAKCGFLPNGQEIPVPIGVSDDEYFKWKEDNKIGRTGTCRNLPNVKVGEIKIIEKQAWTEEIEISPAKEETICE